MMLHSSVIFLALLGELLNVLIIYLLLQNAMHKTFLIKVNTNMCILFHTIYKMWNVLFYQYYFLQNLLMEIQ